uniref:Uncharacterized protein n=1 Tax=Lactuca sativa TaxID=4236 RepID=A0A9R1UF89_LACSA|nr:hypothetical protein LSAT_V11C900474680 [Lactuca sativa]
MLQTESKREFPRSSKSSYMEPEGIEIYPLLPVAYHEIIDVDIDEDRNDVVFMEGKVQSNKKMKSSLVPSNSNAEQGSRHSGVQMDSVGPSHSSKSFVAENFFDLDDYAFEDDDSMDLALKLQSHFDSMDTPTRIEAQIPWFPDNFPMEKNSSKHVQASSSYSGLHANNSSKNLSFLKTPKKIQHQNENVPFNNPRSSSLTGSSSSMTKVVDNEDVIKRYESFKKFDTVVDFSDHYYATQSS